ncbi:MAG: hypothetical protein ACRCT1_08120 [Microcoleaceae cyanobacterium]
MVNKGRRKKEEGRRKKEEGRRKKEDFGFFLMLQYLLFLSNLSIF